MTEDERVTLAVAVMKYLAQRVPEAEVLDLVAICAMAISAFVAAADGEATTEKLQ